MPEPIYLDHAATTPVRDEVRAAMEPFLGPRFGNPSSAHRWGRDARTALDEARERVARCLNARPDEVCFTSGGTEGDNLAVFGPWRARRAGGRRAIVTSPIEHKAVLAAVHHAAERDGAEERVVPVDGDGLVDREAYRAALAGAAVASVMWVNNEVGVVQPIAELGAEARAQDVVFHTDAVQAFGKIAIDVTTLPADLLTISGHKIGAPKGIGAIYIRRGTPLEPLFYGGAQDRGRRPGTENVAFAVGLALAAELAVAEREEECARLGAMRDAFEARLLAEVPDAVIHGRGAPRAPHVCNVSVPGVDAESLLMALDLQGIAASGGSACQTGNAAPSHVLLAMGVAPELAAGAVRLSFGCLSTPEQVDRVASLLPAMVARARAAASAVPVW
ncbi:cysteine desulfurase family protein [Roseisolibacter sp. H3M3-2]|uniref:cysteine desulfurase family protein n=1 Tax=Roseisolibacter sp. H3M3-2 TaxID=3031323 RepID=UPI0023D9D16D|nr:cysteine desulfurase family protein [Roseisolibacter sp. H3M3-2]MDF1502674.1 cysteine desulfurase family protein [Roseisolibacter sp. H3M3-2]